VIFYKTVFSLIEATKVEQCTYETYEVIVLISFFALSL